MTEPTSPTTYHYHQPDPAPSTTNGNWNRPDPKKPFWKNRSLLWPAGALLVGLAIGGANTPEPVETIVEKPVEKIVEKRIEVKTTPPSCLTALDNMEKGFTVSGEVMGYMQEALTHAVNRDVASINAVTAKIEDANVRLRAISPVANAAKAECRAAK